MTREESARARPPSPRPLSSFRVAWLISAMEARRWLNRRPWKRLSKDKPRSGTARKGAPAKLLLGVVSIVLAFNVVNNATRIVHGIAVEAEQRATPGIALVSRDTLDWIDLVLRHERPLGTLWRSDQEQLHEVFDSTARDELSIDKEERELRVAQLEAVYAHKGRAGFRESQIEDGVWPSTRLWFRGSDPFAMLGPLGLIVFALALGVTPLSVVGSDRDLARSESSLEWWFTFPVPTRGLLLARVIGSALISPLLWLLLFPFLSVVFLCAGFGPWLGCLLGVCACLYFGMLAGSLRVAAETSLRALLPLRRVAQLQAALELVSTLPLILAFAASTKIGLAFVIDHSQGLPTWALYNPLTLPLCWLLPLPSSLGSVLASLVLASLSVYGAVSLGSYMLRDGLTSTSGPLIGSRKSGPRSTQLVSSEAPSLFRVIARRELISIARDPGRVARVLIFPITFMVLTALTDPSFFRAIVGSPSHASAAAFFVGAFVLIGGGLLTLANEGPGLWLLYTMPCSLDSILIRRAGLWALLAALFTILTLVVLSLVGHDLTFLGSGHALLALVGAGLYGFIAVALGALGTDVLESERTRRMQPFTAQLFLLLAGMFTFALYSPSAWTKFAQLSLSALFAFALWQKLRDHTPYLLDPTEAPPPQIAVADGIFAALAFFVLQGLLGLLFTKLRFSPGISLVFAFSGAGLLVAFGAIYTFSRMGVPDLPAALGVRITVHTSAEARLSKRAAPERAALIGVLAGGLGGAIAIGYTRAIESIDWLHRLYEQAEALEPSAEQLPWLCGLAVFAAPLFEELIFRGILYRGFRRSLGPLYAALASSLVFALMHPPMSFVPVFIMAMLAATVFERSRLLLAPIMAHMTYNAIIVGITLSSQH